MSETPASPTPGALLSVVVGSGTLIDPETTKRVTVSFRYRDPGHSLDSTADLVFTGDGPDYQTWTIPIADATKTTYTYQMRYLLADGAECADEPVETSADKLLLGFPPLMHVAIACSADFTGVSAIRAVLRYSDPPNQIDATESVIFTEADQAMRKWRVILADRTRLTYSVAVVHTLSDGRTFDRPPYTTSNSVIVIEGPTIRHIAVEAGIIDFAATPRVDIRLTYRDAANDLTFEKALRFDAGGPRLQEWRFPLVAPQIRTVRYGVTYTLADSTQQTIPDVATDYEMIVVEEFATQP